MLRLATLENMPFIEMDPSLVWSMIEGYQNELAPEQRALDAFYAQKHCPQCGGSCRKEVISSHTFSDASTVVPRSVLRCLTCECLFDPHSGLRLEMGNLGKAEPAIPIIDPSDR